MAYIRYPVPFLTWKESPGVWLDYSGYKSWWPILSVQLSLSSQVQPTVYLRTLAYILFSLPVKYWPRLKRIWKLDGFVHNLNSEEQARRLRCSELIKYKLIEKRIMTLFYSTMESRVQVLHKDKCNIQLNTKLRCDVRLFTHFFLTIQITR